MTNDFLRAVLYDSAADAPRLVYADWLDDHGDPRGEFIRVQCALAKLPRRDARRGPLEQRERELLAAHGSTWEAPVRSLVEAGRFRRGFVEFARIDARRFLDRGGELWHRAPIRHLEFIDVSGLLASLAQSPLLAKLDALTVYASHQGAVPRALAASPHLAGLRELYLGRNVIDDVGAAALAQSPHLRGLRRLDLSENAITLHGARLLAASPHLGGLATLDLSRNRIDAAGAEALARSPHLSGLRSLRLAHARLPARVAGLVAEPAAARWEALDLSGNDLGDAVAHAVADAAGTLQLRTLDLSRTRLTDDGFARLAAVPLPHLRELAVAGNSLHDRSIRALVDSPWARHLDALDLRHNPFGDGGVSALLATTRLERLAWLDLSPSPRWLRRLRERFGERCRF